MCKNQLFIRNLGRISYPRFIDIKNGIFESEKINGDIKNTLLLVEHSSPLFTFSKKSTTSEPSDALSESKLSLSSTLTQPCSLKNEFDSFKKFSKLGFDICLVEKRHSGMVLHGPGQLTVYTLFSNKFKIDDLQYKSKLENVVQKTLKDLNVNSSIINDQIMVNNQIIGDIKIFNNQFKLPGFSLNVNTNFGNFNETQHLTSISKIMKSSLSVSDIIPLVSNNYKTEFNFETINDLYSYYMSLSSTTNNNHSSISLQQQSQLESQHIFNSTSQKPATIPLTF